MDILKLKDEASIVISGEAGQGLQSIEKLFAALVKSEGYNVFTYSEFMSRIRGGNNTTFIRVAGKSVMAYVERIDICLPIGRNALYRLDKRISKDTLIIGDKSNIEDKYKNGFRVEDLPLTEMSRNIGGSIYISTILLGLLSALFNIPAHNAAEMIKKRFGTKKDIIGKNLDALNAGYGYGIEMINSGKISVAIEKSELVKNDLMLDGSQAIGMGALAGGCNFIASYPMSPSTGTFTFMAENAREFDVLVEQAEDEIAAMNMGIGAWYAGARAMVTTSGGGFDLMTEAMSLAGAIESPMVVHLGGRPGPSTGLPTRTEQGDFQLALYAGHGEFPRIILAPGDKKDGIKLMYRAFNMADKFQVPVLVLTDQYFLDSLINMKDFGITGLSPERYIYPTKTDYARFSFTENGISQRGIPGYGDGIVCADSDEHNENGYITEDFDVRTKMVNKRLKKYDSIVRDITPPKFFGGGKYKYIVVSWGSTKESIREAIGIIDRDDIANISFNQLYPLDQNIIKILNNAEKKIIIENNATSQFGSFIRQQTGIGFDNKILKYNGMPFSVEEIVSGIKAAL